MSNTRRKHWYYGGRLKDGFFNKHYPKHFYYTKKNKEPLVEDREYEIDCWLYYFDDWSDLDEGYYCENCGQWLSYYAYSSGLCEC